MYGYEAITCKRDLENIGIDIVQHYNLTNSKAMLPQPTIPEGCDPDNTAPADLTLASFIGVLNPTLGHI